MLKDIKYRYLNFNSEMSHMKDRLEKFKMKVLKPDPFSALLILVEDVFPSCLNS